jgi:hypothetical protein
VGEKHKRWQRKRGKERGKRRKKKKVEGESKMVPGVGDKAPKKLLNVGVPRQRD